MTPQSMTYRASIVSPITWSLLIPTLGACVLALVCLPALLLWNDDVYIAVIMLITVIWLVLMWIYYITLKVTLKEGRLTKTSWLRTTVIVMDEKTLIRHRAASIVLQGVDLSAMFSEVLSQESTTHLQITLRNGDRQVKVGSALKGISKLRDQIIAFESETLLPASLKRLQAGEMVALTPFEFQQDRVICKGLQSRIPLSAVPEIKAGVLSLYLNGKRTRIALKKIWNPVTCLRLLTQGGK